MQPSAVLQIKQQVIAAVRAQRFADAARLLQQVQETSPACLVRDPLLSELLSTLQLKLAQDLEAQDEDAACSDDDGGVEQEADSDSDDEASSSSSTCEDNGASSDGDSEGAAADDEEQQEQPSEQGADARQQQHQQQGSASTAVAQAEAAGGDHGLQPLLGGIQLAAGSCSLSREQRAAMRRQLAAALEEERDAVALARAREKDPLVSV